MRFRKCIRWSRRLFSAPLKMRRVPEKAVSGTEYPSRTVEACFLHRMPLKMRRVPQEAFLSTECVFRTVEACFWYGALPKTHRTWLSGAQESGWQLPLRGLSTLGRGRGKEPPETSSALAGRRKWWKGPERTKRAKSSQRQVAAAAELRTSQSRRVRDFHPIWYVRSGRTKKEVLVDLFLSL